MVLNFDDSGSRRAVEMCYRTRRTLVNPIIDWTDDEVWEFLNKIAKAPHCKLYDEGFKRLGCIGCPLAGGESMKKEFKRWPAYERAYKRAIAKMIENHPGKITLADGGNVGGWLRRANSSRNGSTGVPSVAEMAQIIWDWWID